MTIRFTKSWNGYYEGQIVTNPAGGNTEAQLIALGYAVADLDGPDNSFQLAKFATDTSGNVTGLVGPGGERYSLQRAKRYGVDYEATPGTALYPLSTTTPPSPTGATGTTALDATVLWDGLQTWKVTNTQTSANIAVTHNLAVAYSAPRVAPSLFIPIYIPDYKSLNNIAITLSMGNTAFTNVFAHTTYAIGPTGHADKQRNGWHMLVISPGDWTVGAGTPVWTDTINSIRLRFIKDATGGNDGIAYFGTPYMHKSTVAQLLIYADDVHRSFYNNGLPIFDSLGLRVNLSCAKGWINNASYMSQEMYLDAQDRGHEICVHSLNQIGVNVLTYEDAIADIAENQAYVRDVIRSPFGYKHFVYPNGRYWPSGASRADLSVIDYCRDSLGIVLARTTDDPIRVTYKTTLGLTKDSQKYNQLLLPETLPTNADKTVATAKAAIDTLIAKKAVGTWVQHHVGYDGTDDLMMPAAVQEVAEYIADKVAGGALICPTGADFIAGLSGG